MLCRLSYRGSWPATSLIVRKTELLVKLRLEQMTAKRAEGQFSPFDSESPLQYDADQALLTIAPQHKSLSPLLSAIKLLCEVRNHAL